MESSDRLCGRYDICICMIPITNALGGNQNAWIKFGFIMGIIVILAALICYATSRETANRGRSGSVEGKERG